MTPEEAMQRLSEMRFPGPSIPKLEWESDSRTLAELQNMSDEEIRAFLDGDAMIPVMTVQLALHELAMRELKRATRPHWSLTWTFWAAIGSVIVGLIGVLLAVFK